MQDKQALKDTLTRMHLHAEYQFALFLKGLASSQAAEHAYGEFCGYRRALIDTGKLEYDDTTASTNLTIKFEEK